MLRALLRRNLSKKFYDVCGLRNNLRHFLANLLLQLVVKNLLDSNFIKKAQNFTKKTKFFVSQIFEFL